MTHQPETARELLHRHGLPEDIIDGALCLHAQELAALQRLRMDELDLTGQKARIVGRIVDLIDPTRTPAAVSAAVAPPTTHTDPELTAEEARTLADELGLQLYRAQDALAFVAECCDIADREQRTVTTADVREWLKGARCGRQLAADATGRGDCPDLDAIAARAADAQQYGIEDDGFEQLVREDVPALITALRRMADETATETPKEQ